jgi:RNA polymerase sigma-70 factor (ECF subfamily)
VNYIQRDLKNQKKIISLEEELIEDNEPVDEISDEQIHSLKAEKLSAALQIIKVDEKAILLMKYQDDFSIKEIAAAFEISESAVKMRLSRAKLNLIKIYNT